jgi:hypothetical protein
MPKPKPTEVIRHEIILGRSEKELLENALSSDTITSVIKNVLSSGIVKDWASALAFVEAVAFLLELFGYKTPIPTPVDLLDWWDAQKKKAAAMGDWLNPFPEIWKAVIEGTGGFDPTEGLTPSEREEYISIMTDIYTTTPGEVDGVPATSPADYYAGYRR